MGIKKSGARIELIGEAYNRILCGTLEITNVQTSLVGQSLNCFQVLVQSSRNNTEYILVGNDTDGSFIELAPGQSITIPVNNVMKVCVRAEGGSQTVNWMAMQ